MKKLVALILSFLLLLGCTGCAMEDIVLALDLAIAVLESTETEPSETTAPGDSDPEEIPAYSGNAYVAINGNTLCTRDNFW